MTLETGEAGTLDIVINQIGDYGRFSLEFFRDSEPMDLTDLSPKMHVKVTQDTQKNPVISKEIGSGLSIEGTSNNVLTFDFSVEMYEKKHYSYFYSVTVNEDGKVSTYVKGKLILGKTTTKGN